MTTQAKDDNRLLLKDKRGAPSSLKKEASQRKYTGAELGRTNNQTMGRSRFRHKEQHVLRPRGEERQCSVLENLQVTWCDRSKEEGCEK